MINIDMTAPAAPAAPVQAPADGVVKTPVEIPAGETAELKQDAAPAFIGERVRFKTIDLEWPMHYDGRDYYRVHLVRLTAAQVEKFQEELSALVKQDATATLSFPLFYDDDGNQVPAAVLGALDDDDKLALDKAAVDFLPRRFRGVATEPVSGPAASATTEPSSQASPAGPAQS